MADPLQVHNSIITITNTSTTEYLPFHFVIYSDKTGPLSILAFRRQWKSRRESRLIPVPALTMARSIRFHYAQTARATAPGSWGDF